MTATTIPAGRLQAGLVISTAAGQLRRNLSTLIPLALICCALPDLILAALTLSSGMDMTRASFSSSGIGQSILLGAVAHTVTADLDGRRASLQSSLAAAGKLFLPLWGLSLLTAFGVVFGLFLLVVPGVVLACMWAVAAPVRAVEGPDVWQAMRRSRELTQGHRGGVLLVGVGALGTVLLVSVAAGLLEMAVGRPVGLLVVEPATSAACGLALALISMALYQQLWRIRTGLELKSASQAIASVFE